MVYGTAKDIVRSNLGDPKLNNNLLTFFMEQGRREVETLGNFYWMVSTKDFILTPSRSAFSLTGATDLALTNFKEARYVLAKAQGTTRWYSLRIKGFEEARIVDPTDKVGPPKIAVVNNITLFIFPPTADTTYDIELGFFQWTLMPTAGNTATDELLTFWPQTAIWAATMVGVLHKTKDALAAKPYADLLQNELAKIQIYSDNRLRIPDIQRAHPQQAQAPQAAQGG